MGLFHRTPQLASAPLPDISAPANLDQLITASGNEYITSGASAAVPTPSAILAALTATSGASSTTAISSSPAISTSSATSNHHDWQPNVRIIAIVVPLVALVLIIPILAFWYRSRQLDKLDDRSSLHSSQEAMLQKPASPEARMRTTPTRSAGQGTRPANSLGLFNFDLSPPGSPTFRQSRGFRDLISPRRSQALLPFSNRSSPKLPETRHPSDNSLPPLIGSPPGTQDAHFAPLHRIGGPQQPRPRSPRGTSSRTVYELDGYAQTWELEAPDAYGRVRTRGTSQAKPQFAKPRGRFSITDYMRMRDSSMSVLSSNSDWLNNSRHSRRPRDQHRSDRSEVVSPIDNFDYRGIIRPFAPH